MEGQLSFLWYPEDGLVQEGSLTLDDQIAFAQSLLANGERVKKLLADREKLAADLAKVDEELAGLLPAAPAPPSSRAAQKCSVCGQEGHTKRTCPKKG
jgi:hypothetical protein